MEKESIKDFYEHLISLDKEIVALEKQIWDYFIDNVDEEYKNGEVKIPLVGNSSLEPSSFEYEKLRYYIKEIYLEINQIKQKLKKIDYYAMSIRSNIIRDKVENVEEIDENEIEEITKRRTELYATELSNYIKNLKARLELINENQKIYLRFKDCQKYNFETIKSEEAKNKLKKMKKELSKKKKESKKISKSIESTLNINEDEEKNKEKFSFTFKPSFDKNKKKRY